MSSSRQNVHLGDYQRMREESCCDCSQAPIHTTQHDLLVPRPSSFQYNHSPPPLILLLPVHFHPVLIWPP